MAAANPTAIHLPAKPRKGMTDGERLRVVTTGGHECPHCGAGPDTIDRGEVTVTDDTPWRASTCTRCGAKWLCFYRISHAEGCRPPSRLALRD